LGFTPRTLRIISGEESGFFLPILVSSFLSENKTFPLSCGSSFRLERCGKLVSTTSSWNY